MLYLSGNFCINSSALLKIAAFLTSSSVANKLPYLILSAILPENSILSCRTVVI